MATLPIVDEVGLGLGRSHHRGRRAASARQGSPVEAMTKPDLDWEGRWAAKFKTLQRNPKGKRRAALEWAKDDRFDLAVILEFVAGCTHPNADENEFTLRVKRNLRERLRRLESLNRQVRKMQEALQDLKTEPLVSHFRPISVELPSALRSASYYLSRPALRKAFDKRKVPSGFALIALCLYVRRVSGASSYVHLAELLEAGYQAHGTPRIVNPDSLARRVRNFKRDHPQIAEALGKENWGGR